MVPDRGGVLPPEDVVDDQAVVDRLHPLADDLLLRLSPCKVDLMDVLFSLDTLRYHRGFELTADGAGDHEQQPAAEK